MAIVPGSGASIVPVFNDSFGVDSVIVKNGGSGYDPNQPPILRIKNCGTPTRECVLEPVISNGKIVSVKVLDPGEGYNPLRVKLTPNVPEGEEEPDPAKAEVVLKEDGSIDYIKVIRSGDKQFYDVEAEILGSVGSGASIRAVPRTVTGLSILNSGRGYETPPFLSISGGGGRGARGVAEIDSRGIVSSNITISDPGQFYLQEPYVLLVGGGGLGAKAKAVINQGSIQEIVVTDPGAGYTSAPKVVFARKVQVNRKTRNRQSYNLQLYNITGITRDVGRSDTDIYLSTTEPYPGSGVVLLEKELIRYTGKDSNRLTGCTRGINFRYDQRIIVDDLQDDPQTGLTEYNFNIGDRLIRSIENASNKIAKVYDWKPETKELFIVFEVDELAFIDAGTPGERSNVVFDAGVSNSSDAFDLPHIIEDFDGGIIYQLTSPLSFIVDKRFQDNLELDGQGDGYPDLVNTGTDYQDQINLDGGNPSTRYGIEETVGGQNTTLFEVGDKIRDSSVPFKVATVSDAGGLSEGVEHFAIIKITMDTSNPAFFNSVNFVVGEQVTGLSSNVEATVVSWDSASKTLILENPIPYDTGDPDIGFINEFSYNSTITQIRVIETGNNYISAPTVNIEDISTIAASAVSSLTADQVTSITVNSGGYGYEVAPEITFSGGSGSGATAQAILGGELISGENGALWRISQVEYETIVRNDTF